MEYPEAPEGRILVGSWSNEFDKSTSPDLSIALNKCDIVYALDGEDALQSLKKRIYSSKAKAFPKYVNNNASAVEWLIKEYGDDKFTFVPPEEMFAYTGLGEDCLKRLEGHKEELKKRMPEGLKDAMDNVTDEIDKMVKNREELLDKYIERCKLEEVGPEQAKDELERYFKTEIPASEFIAPVGMCRALKEGLDGMPDFNPFEDDK